MEMNAEGEGLSGVPTGEAWNHAPTHEEKNVQLLLPLCW